MFMIRDAGVVRIHASFLLPMVQLEERAGYHATTRQRDHGTNNDIPRRTETLSE